MPLDLDRSAWSRRLTSLRLYNTVFDDPQNGEVALIDDVNDIRNLVVFRGLVAGNGINLELVDADDHPGTNNYKIKINAGNVSGGNFGLNDLVDVNIPTPNDNDILVWDAQNGVWVTNSFPNGEINTGNNLGNGFEIFSGKTNDTFNFKTLTTTGDISITENNDELNLNVNIPVNSVNGKTGDVVLNASDVNAADVNHDHTWDEITNKPDVILDAENVGNGEEVYKETLGDLLRFKTLTTSGDLTINSSTDEINLDVSIPVNSVNGKTGDVVLNANDVNAADVNHTHTWSEITNKPNIPSKLRELGDVESYDVNNLGNNSILSWDAGQQAWTTTNRTFLNLDDTPTDYSGNGGKLVKVKNDETGLTFGSDIDVSLNDINNTNISNVQSGDIIQYNGTNWVNTQLSGSSSNIAVEQNSNILTSDLSKLIFSTDFNLTENNNEITIDFSLGDLSSINDVDSYNSGNLQNNTILAWDSSQGIWSPKELKFIDLFDTPSGYSGDNNKLIAVNNNEDGVKFVSISNYILNDFGNVSISSPQSGEALVFDGTNWVNQSQDTSSIEVSSDGTTVTTDVQKLNFSNDFNVTESNNEVSVSLSGSVSGSTALERFRIEYSSNGDVSAITNVSGGISVNLVNASASQAEVEVTFNNYSIPPIGNVVYGYAGDSKIYVVDVIRTSFDTHQLEAYDSNNNLTTINNATSILMRLSVREADTNASREFGGGTHAWINFTMGG